MAIGAGLGVPGLIIFLLFSLLGGGSSGDGGGPGDVFGDVLNDLGQAEEPEQPPDGPDPDARLVDFMSFVLDDVQNTWEQIFQQSGETYPRAKLVLFTTSTTSSCGGATSNIGPHYCPADQNVYIDLDFFRELRNQFGAPGDFAQAYVLAHEIGHHVQNVLGINERVYRDSQRDPDLRNELSIRLELQADCFAGIWGFTAADRGLLEPGDLQEGLGAAEAVGDDRIQEQAGQRIDPENWTHGSSEQRMEWFNRGFESGDPGQCDTFAPDDV
jgi:uncharacterized protein